MEIVQVTSIEVLGHYQLRLGFSDGLVREVDLTHLRDRQGVFAPLHDPDYFALVQVDPEGGTIVWPNGADLDPLVLHGDFAPASEERKSA